MKVLKLNLQVSTVSVQTFPNIQILCQDTMDPDRSLKLVQDLLNSNIKLVKIISTVNFRKRMIRLGIGTNDVESFVFKSTETPCEENWRQTDNLHSDETSIKYRLAMTYDEGLVKDDIVSIDVSVHFVIPEWQEIDKADLASHGFPVTVYWKIFPSGLEAVDIVTPSAHSV